MTTVPSPRKTTKRKQIQSAARKLFLSRGYAGTSMDLITSEAGISKQTLYRYYTSKEILFADLLNEVIHELTEEKQPSLAVLPVPESREQLCDILLQMARIISRKLADPLYVSILRIVLSEAARFPELGDLFLKTVPQSIEVLANLLRQCMQSGLVKLADEDVEMSIEMFIGPFVSHTVFRGLMQGDPAPEPMPTASLERLCRIYVNAIT